MDLKYGVSLADYTTIGLGGDAKYFISCRTIEEIRSAFQFAEKEKLPVQILGGGSNVVFPDEGFDGLVVKIDLKGIEFNDDGDFTSVSARAGEIWDELVTTCVERNLSGVECLSGIPGSVGATPIQNVGAYGQEVKDTIVSVKALDRSSLELVEFSASQCEFGYRKSRFKENDKDKFVIVAVDYKLKKSGEPSIKYEELRDYLKSKRQSGDGVNLAAVRQSVLALRRKKSMVIDQGDANSRSVGSFFLNPILSVVEFESFIVKLNLNGIKRAPSYKSGDGIKISAAWLIENSGFYKGYKRDGVGISANHSLALANYSGTTNELLSLATGIENAVREKFGLILKREAVVVQRSGS
ncbi:MAG: UDP-N-acetylmuramate dehydrogenase [Candidatus Kryptoniota bacterium]